MLTISLIMPESTAKQCHIPCIPHNQGDPQWYRKQSICRCLTSGSMIVIGPEIGIDDYKSIGWFVSNFTLVQLLDCSLFMSVFDCYKLALYLLLPNWCMYLFWYHFLNARVSLTKLLHSQLYQIISQTCMTSWIGQKNDLYKYC